MKQIILLFVLLLIQSAHWIGAQSFKVVQDPLGHEIHINKDSSYIFDAFGYLMAFAINQEDDTRNVLVFDGDTSYWLFNQGVNKNLTWTPFTRTEKNGFAGNSVWFSIGSIWYETNGTPGTTKVFNDNSNPDSTYQYLQLFNFKTGDLGIEAIERSSGDTLVLFYNPTNQKYQIFKDEFGNPIKVIQVAEPLSFNEVKEFIGAQFNPLTQEFDFYGLYSWSAGSLTQRLELGKRTSYDVEFVYKDYISYQYIIDKISSDSATVYQYNNSTGNFDDVSSTVINGYEVIEAYNLPSVYYDRDLNDKHSFDESIWKCKVKPLGAIRYIFRSAFTGNVEINNLRDQPSATFMYASIDDDSIYYYNHSPSPRGLFRFNTVDKNFIFHQSSIPFDNDYQIRGWKGRMYFGRYDQATSSIVAAYKSFDDGTYTFIESFDGDQVDQPIDFSFLDNKVFIHSKQSDGIKLYYFDPTPIVATHDLNSGEFDIIISPNPGKGEIHISLPTIDASVLGFKEYAISDVQGRLILHGNILNQDLTFNMGNQPAGLYFITLINGNDRITKPFSIE